MSFYLKVSFFLFEPCLFLNGQPHSSFFPFEVQLMEILTNTMKGNCVGKFFLTIWEKYKKYRIASGVVIIRLELIDSRSRKVCLRIFFSLRYVLNFCEFEIYTLTLPMYPYGPIYFFTDIHAYLNTPYQIL
jgi:hypothetical protein